MGRFAAFLMCWLWVLGVSGSSAQDVSSNLLRLQNLEGVVDDLTSKLAELEQVIANSANVDQSSNDTGYPQDCESEGVFMIAPNGSSPFYANCLTDVGHTWTVIQQRFDNSTDFNREWDAYKWGFGEIGLTSNYWLGLENIFRLTMDGIYLLRISLEDWEGGTADAEYLHFHLDDEHRGYRLRLGSYHGGSAGDALVDGEYRNHVDLPFSTPDCPPVDGCNTAAYYGSGWWFRTHRYGRYANLNGEYHTTSNVTFYHGIQWYPWKGGCYSLKMTKMMVRRLA